MEQAAPEVTIQVRDNGNYKITGPIRIVDAEGNELVLPPGTAVTLCRCGHSETKPFCDGSHKRVGFQSVVRAPGPFGSA